MLFCIGISTYVQNIFSVSGEGTRQDCVSKLSSW